jgi:SAM-dependent methyltransferase
LVTPSDREFAALTAVQKSFQARRRELVSCCGQFDVVVDETEPTAFRRIDRRWSGYDTFSEQTGEKSMSSDKVAAFAGTLAEFYDRYLVPLIFAPYAEVVADRARALLPRRVLETAAGTGVVTEALARTLPTDVTITATDLNEPMIERAKVRPGMERVNWQQADAMKLPFPNGAFDLIVCQFGVMFFPDKRASFKESFRVLAPWGTYLFLLWDDYVSMSNSPVWIAAQTVGDMLGRDPHTLVSPAYFDEPTIRADLAAAGFPDIKINRIVRTARAASARDAAVITVQGSLLRTAIETADPSRLGEATKAVEQVMLARFGEGPVEGETKALIVATTKPQ